MIIRQYRRCVPDRGRTIGVKKYPKIVQCDSRGQIVIPKDVRRKLGIDEGSGFWMFAVEDEGIFLKKIDDAEFSEESSTVKKLKSESKKIGINPKKVDATVKQYTIKKGGLEEI